MIHGGLSQDERILATENFSEEQSAAMIATDISARGIDFKKVSHVINYDLPDNPENYVHRVGRTGRGNNYGEAITFCAPEEKDKRNEVEDFLGKDIQELETNTAYLLENGPASIENMEISDILAMEEANF